MEKFVKVTYTLEEVFIAFQQLEELRQFIYYFQRFASLTHLIQQLFLVCMMRERVWCLLSNTTDALVRVFQEQSSCSIHELLRHSRGELLQMFDKIGAVPFLDDDNTIKS